MDARERGRVAGAMTLEVIEARTALLDAMEALGAHRESVILVGAQAIYLRTGAADVALAEFTTDADIVIDPRGLGSDPLVETAMRAAGFVHDPGNPNPGAWVSPRGIPVDLMVPDQVAGPGRRGVSIPPHDRRSMRRTVGLEAALIDNSVMSIGALSAGDERVIDVRVAGSAALLVAKLHKLNERLETPRRQDDKDAHDIYRILVASDTHDLAGVISALLSNELSREVTAQALQALRMLFATGPDARGSTMAGRAERAVGDPHQVALASSILAADLLMEVEA